MNFARCSHIDISGFHVAQASFLGLQGDFSVL
jgi:hypothetical protein